jgi:molybdenum cofactor guanylyltransferase
VLAAVIAGGRSRRFGSDKAAATLKGQALLDHVISALVRQADQLIVVGRDWPGCTSVADYPNKGLGPLGGLCAALRYAEPKGFDEVLTAGCDVLPVPPHLRQHLSPGPAVVRDQPLFGLWPATLFTQLLQHLAGGADRSIRGWIEVAAARQVRLDVPLHNMNTRDDLESYRAGVAREE